MQRQSTQMYGMFSFKAVKQASRIVGGRSDSLNPACRWRRFAFEVILEFTSQRCYTQYTFGGCMIGSWFYMDTQPREQSW